MAATQAGSPPTPRELSTAQIIQRAPQSHHLILLHILTLQDSGRATCR